MRKYLKNRSNPLKKIAARILRKELGLLRKSLKDTQDELNQLYLHVARSKDKQEAPTKVVVRLTRGEYERLRTQLQTPVVTSTTTALEAAAMVGQQRVLDILERGFVSDA